MIFNKGIFYVKDINNKNYYYYTLDELADDWEDYLSDLSYIDSDGEVYSSGDLPSDEQLEIGNYFETKEEAEKAVEKLKAWKRLKDKGFMFDGWETWEDVTGCSYPGLMSVHSYYARFTFGRTDRLEEDTQIKADLDLFFGCKE